MTKRKYNFRSHSTKNTNERIEVRAYNSEELEQVNEASNKKIQDDNHKKSHETVAQESFMTLESNNLFFLLINDIILINILLSCFLESTSTYIKKRDNAKQAGKWFI